MQKLSTAEWIAVTVAVILGFALFLIGFFLFSTSQSLGGVPEQSASDVVETGETVESGMPVPGAEGAVEETIASDEAATVTN